MYTMRRMYNAEFNESCKGEGDVITPTTADTNYEMKQGSNKIRLC